MSYINKYDTVKQNHFWSEMLTLIFWFIHTLSRKLKILKTYDGQLNLDQSEILIHYARNIPKEFHMHEDLI